MSRLEKICKLAVKAVAEQLLDDELSESFFEESFRKDGRAAFSPIEIQIDDETVFVEGKIDRVDFMGDTGVRVVDYKTGNDEVNKEHLRNGYKMQLMVYLEGACDNAHKPAGVFYFNIKDELPNITKEKAEKAKDKIEENKKRFELRGLYVTENNDPESRHSGAGKAKSIGITSEEFEDIRKDVRNTMKDIASGIINGDIRINPVYQGTKTNAKIECTYCQYRSICRFDLSYDGNEYRYIK